MWSAEKIFALMLVIGIVCMISFMLIVTTAQAEHPAQEGWCYVMESKDMRFSEFPIYLTVQDVFAVDLDEKAILEQDFIEAIITMPIEPESLYGLLLYDEWHIAHGYAEVIEGYRYRVIFFCEELRKFDFTQGVYLIVVTDPPDMWRFALE